MDEEPFVYAHLIKFEKALSTISKQGSRKASTYSYITDGSRDIVFDDGTKALDGTSNGAQTYVANKVRRVGNITEKSIPSAHSIKIEIDAVALFTQNSLSVNISQDNDGTYAGKTGTMSASVDWVELGYSEGDILKVIWEHSSVQYERKIRIERFTTSNSVIVWSAAIEYGPEAYPHGWGHNTYFIQAGSVQIATPLTANIVYCSDEGTGPLIKKTSTGYANYINRDVFIYKAHIDPDTHAFIGEPYLIYKGIVQAAKLTEDPKGKRLIAWSIASHWSDFNRVTGRLTSDEHHRQVSYDTEAREVLKRPEYASDLGFQHSSQAVNLIATYQVKETKYKIKNKKGLFKSKAKLIETEVDVDTEADIRFNLTPKYLPVIYGVNKVKGIPFFVDTHYQKTAQVFVTYALCEGEVSSLYDIHFEGTSSLCSDSQDFNTRNPVHGSLGFSDPKNAANEDIDIICLGRVDKGEVLQGQTTTDATKFQKLYQVQNAMAVRRYRSKRFREDIAPVFLYGPYPQVGTVAFWDADLTNYMFLTATAGTDMLGITTGKGVSFATPTDVRMVFHDGSPNQKADPFLTYMAGNQYFKIQGDYFTGDKANYWGPNHRVLDTAYVTAKWTINEGESDIPETSYTVKGQLIPCYNYDYSFTTAGVVQNGFIPSTSANLAGGPVATRDTLESLSELFKIGAEVDAYGFGVVPGAAPVTTFGHADNNALGTSLGKVTIEEIFLTQTKDAVIVPRIRISKSPAIAATQDTVSTFATSYVRHGLVSTDIEIEGTEDDLNLFLVGQTIKAPNLSNDGKGSFFPNLGASDALPTIIQFAFGEHTRDVLDINGNVIGEETYNAIRIRLSTAASTAISYRGLRLEIAVGGENFENNPKHRLFYLKSGTKKLYLERHDYSVASGTVAAEVSVPLNSTPATAITAGTQPTDSDSPVETNAQGIKITLDSTSAAAKEVMKNLASSQSFSLVRSGRNRRTNSTSKHQMETLFGYYTDSLSYTDGASSGTIDNIGVSNPAAPIGSATILDEAREEINLLISRDQINLTTSNMLPKTAAYNNYFNGYLLKLTATAADGSVYVQDRTITAYDGLTAIATVDEPWHSGYVPLTNTTYHTNTLDTFTFEIFPQPDYRTSINPAIQTLDYLTSERYGLGLNKDIDIDLEKFKKAARDCDERSNISVFVEKESANTPVIGETYVYPDTTAPTWMGTVNNFHERTYSVHNLNSGNPVDYYQIIFSNCKGKLVHRATDWKELQTNMLVYFQEPGPTGSTSLYKTPTLESAFATGGFSTGGTANHGLFYSIIGHNTYIADNNVKNGDTMPGKAERGDGVPIPFRTNTTTFPNLRTAVGGGQSFGDDDDSLPPSSAITSININRKGNWYIQALIGYFRPPTEGKWDFRIQSDDTASVYIGDLALAPDRTTRTTANAVTVQTAAAKGWGTSRDGTTDATNSFYTHVPEGRTQDGTLYTDIYYPIKIVWHAGGYGNYFRFFYKSNSSSTYLTNFGTNFFYWRNGHNYSRRTSTSGAAPLTTSNVMDTDTNEEVVDTAELSLVGANLYGFDATSKSLKLEHASATFDGNKIIKGWSGTYPGGSGYSLYDADDVKYWRMCGWDEHAQTSATRHQLNPKIETSKPFFANLNNLLSQFNGVLRFNNSKYELVIEKEADNVLDSIENSTTLERYTPGSLTADDIIGAINIEDQGIKKAFNTIACTYTAPDNLFENREVTFLNSDYLKEDKYVPKKGSAKVEFITNYHNARMQAKQMLEASRYSTTITFTIGPKGVLLLPGEIIEITYPNFDWANKQFRIETLVQKADCLVQVTATEHNDYTYNSVNSLTASASQGSEGGGGASSDITKTSFPTALTATTNTKGGITLNWTNSSVFAPQTHTVEIYRSIYNRREATQLPWNGTTVENITAPTLIGTTTGTSFTDSLATANAAVGEFYYWIRYQILVQAKSAATAPKLAVSRYEPAGNGVEGKGGPAIDGVVINLSNSSSTVPTNTSDALVFDNTGTTITVKEGNTALDYNETLQLFPHLLSPREAVTSSTQFLLPGFFEGLSIVTGMTLTVHSSDSSTSISGGSATITALDKEYSYRAWNNRVTLNKAVTLTTDSVLQISGPGSKRSSFKVTGRTPSSGVTVGTGSGTGTTFTAPAITGLTGDTGHIDFTVVVTNSSGQEAIFTPRQTFSKALRGASGINAKTVVLTADKYVISYNEAGTESSSITCTATPKNISSATYKFELDGVEKQAASSTATYTIADGDEPTAGTSKLVKVTAFDSGSEVATDTISVFGVKEGENSLTVVATNEAHVFPANAGGEIAAGDFADGGIDFRVFRGSTQLNVGSGNNEFDVAATTATGITAGTGSTVSTSTKRFAAPSGMAASTDKASILFTITAKNPAGVATTITKLQTFTKSKKGESTVTLTISNENVTIPQAIRTVQATPYTDSGTVLEAFDGATALQFAVKSAYDALSSANKKGVFTITSATGTNITPGAITDIGTGASIANAQSMTATTASIEFTIEGFRNVANGGAALPPLTKTQNFSEATQGTPAVDSKVRLSIFKSFSSILSLPTDDDGFPEGDNFYTISTGVISGDDIPNYTATRPTLTTAKPYLYRRDGIITITAGQTGQIDLTAANTFGDMILDNTLQITKKELIIYQNTNSSTAPGNPNGSLTYTIATDVVSGSNLGSWSDSVPAPDISKPYLWTARQVIEYDNSSTTVSVAVQHWVVSLLLVRSIRGTATYTFDVSDTTFMTSQGTGTYSQTNSSFISGRATAGNAGANAFTVAWAGTLSNAVGRAIVGLVQNNSPDGAIHEGDVVKIIDTTDSANPEIATRIFRINPSMSSSAQPRAYGSPFGPASSYTSTAAPNWQSILTTTGSSNYWSEKVVEKFDGSVIVEGTLAANAITTNSVLTKNIGLGTGGSITLSGTSGKIVQGKTLFDTAVAGFFLGLDNSTPKFIIGDADMVGSTAGKGIYWDGTVLGVRGDISGGGITSSAGAGTGAGFFLDDDGTAFIGKENNSFKVTADGIELNAPISSDSVIGGGITVTQFGTFGTGATFNLPSSGTQPQSLDVGTIPATAAAARPKATVTASCRGSDYNGYHRFRLFLVMNDAGAQSTSLTATISNVNSFDIYNTTFHIVTFSAGYANFSAGDILTQGSNSFTAGTKYASGSNNNAILYPISGAVPSATTNSGVVNVEAGESGDTVVATGDISFDQGSAGFSAGTVTLTGYLPQATSSAVTVKLQAVKYYRGTGTTAGSVAWSSSDHIYNVFGFGESV